MTSDGDGGVATGSFIKTTTLVYYVLFLLPLSLQIMPLLQLKLLPSTTDINPTAARTTTITISSTTVITTTTSTLLLLILLLLLLLLL